MKRILVGFLAFVIIVGGAFALTTRRTIEAEDLFVNGAFSVIPSNVGIGTTDATSKLTVTGTIEITSGSNGGLKFSDGTIQTTATSIGPTGHPSAIVGPWIWQTI